MVDVDMFKKVACEKLPESLYRQLEPHIEAVLSECYTAEECEWAFAEWDHQYQMKRNRRYEEIKSAFDEANAPQWPAFARERWPEIDEYFDLTPQIAAVNRESRP